jgi:peptidoglycan hydrolase CwlO-like protein
MGVAIHDLNNSPTSGSHASKTKTTYTQPSPSYTPPKTAYSPPKQSAYNPPGANADSTLYKDAQGRTYRVPNSAYQRLLLKKAEIDTQQRRLTLAKSEVESLGAEIERLRRTIDQTSQYEIDAFNSKVERFNSKSDQLQIQIDSFNDAVDSFNAELERVGTPIR